MAAPKKIDYALIEPAWRAGIKTPEQLAADYTAETGVKVSRAAIIKHFNKLGVPRDLSAKINAKAEAMVSEAMVTGKVSTVTTKTDSEIINNGAIVVAEIRMGHRKDISKARKVALSLLDELEAMTDHRDLFEDLGIMLRSEDDKGQDKRNDLYNKIISGAGRVDSMKKLAETLKTLIALEREAYNIDSGKPDDQPKSVADLDARIEYLMKKANGGS